MSKKSDYTKTKCRRVLNSITKVLETNDMEQLSKQAYTFCTHKLGFIAHYDHGGFKGVYKQLGVKKFAQNLITGEMKFPDFNKTLSEDFLRGKFSDQFSEEECKNIGNTIKSIISVARNTHGLNFE